LKLSGKRADAHKRDAEGGGSDQNEGGGSVIIRAKAQG
jgi:hypothetical protein